MMLITITTASIQKRDYNNNDDEIDGDDFDNDDFRTTIPMKMRAMGIWWVRLTLQKR